MSATLASPLNTGSTVPASTPVTVPCRTPTCAWAPAAPSNSAMTIDEFFSLFMSVLRDRVARRLAGNDALYWRRREFGYLSRSRVDLLLRHEYAPNLSRDSTNPHTPTNSRPSIPPLSCPLKVPYRSTAPAPAPAAQTQIAAHGCTTR